MLSDSCCDFVSLHAQKKIPLAQGVRQLAKDVEHYARCDYPSDDGSQIDALRRATKRVISQSFASPKQEGFQLRNEEALLWLLALAECVRHYYDGVWVPGASVDKWCAGWLQEVYDIEAGRCPYCGAAKTP